MNKVGLKLWSINKDYVSDALRLYEKGVYDYIELLCVPNSYRDFIFIWKELAIPYIVHAAHSAVGLNLAKKEMFDTNLILADEAKRFADELKADVLIFHPGMSGDINQTVLQLNKINDDRIVIENKPYYGLVDDLICVGNSPEEIEFILRHTGVNFCLDIGHAICSANAQKNDVFLYLKKFMKLMPKMYHLSDGDADTIYDQHKNLGKGSFRLQEIVNILDRDLMISIETSKSSKFSLNDFEEDVIFLRSLRN